MPSNIITVQVGQCGNQLGMAYWERMCLEHGIASDGQLLREDQRGADCKDIFFNENCGQKWVPRALLVDLEPRVLSDICNHENNAYSELFDMDNIYQGPTGGGAGNNWARGYNPGGRVMEDIMELLEAETERADHLEGFAMCHSILGGTGSGLGSRILMELKDRYPKKLIQTYSTVQPMTCNVQVAPYNIVLSLESIMEHADTCLLFDNDAFERHCKEANPLQKLRRDGTNSDDLANPSEKKNYAKVNSMMSQVMTSLSAPIRFYSPVYSRLMQISASLNPFPPMIFLQPAITPFVPTREEGPKQQLIRFPRPKDVISNLADPRHLISSSQAILKRSGEAERLNNYLLSGLIIVQSMAQNEAMSFSGSVAAAGIGISDLYSHMRSRNQSRTNDNVYKSPPWMPSTMHLTSCRLSPYLNHDQHPVTGLLLANHTQISVMLKSMANDFEKMWKRKANVHQYESAFDKGDNNPDAGKDECEKKMSASKESLDKLLALYREACSDNFLGTLPEEHFPKEKAK
uniref:Tubulin/FtsZ GTPase domain-containing protein n=1 Tax=Globodera rostochiensis TaxID=31243 RepID=A0A914HG26_GLORO